MFRFPSALVSCCSVTLLGAAGILGFVYANGTYRIDGSTVRGNATVFDGSILETQESPARLQFGDGTHLWLASGSSVKFSPQVTTLLRGLVQLQGGEDHALSAGAIKVTPGPDSIVRIMLESSGGAVVMPLGGIAKVSNARGIPVGNLAAGQAVRFAAYEGAAAAVESSGCIERRSDGFALTDSITNLTFQLEGRDLDKAAGKHIHLLGVWEPSRRNGRPGVRVTAIEYLGSSACTPAQHAAVLLTSGMPGQAPQTPASKLALNIVVVEGEGAINNIRQRTVREPIVEVQDENHRPVAGALVLFALPRSGPGGSFANGATTLSVTTDQQGRAAARGFEPNRQTGQYQITVTASYAGVTATAAITQVNTIAAATAASAAGTAAAHTMSLASKVAIIAGVSATATVGGLAASGAILTGGSSEPPASR